MNKSSLKNFAIEARRELMEKVASKLKLLGIDKNKITAGTPMGAQIDINGKLYNRSSYDALVRKYNELGYEELVEESAYIWFNRLTALAYMECNGYLEEKIIYSTTSKTDPDIVDTYADADFFSNLSREEQEKIHDLKDSNKTEEMYSILVEAKCQELSNIMPFMFTKAGDFSEILFPQGLLMDNSVLVRLRKEVADSKDEDGTVPVELIGWLYQFYNSEKKDEVFEGLKKNQKITKENIPAATQLFTPKWIVKYMVENSLGKLALESLGASEKLKENWKYYIESEKDEDTERLKIEDIKILDPAMGSGHMLTYSFDLLFDIYEDLGWGKKDAVLSILKNNIYGLEIDERAGQLASFATMMKGREKFPRLFKVLERLDDEEKFDLHILTIQESNAVSEQTRNLISENKLENLSQLIENFKDAKEYGSILKLEKIEKSTLKEELKKLKEAFDKVGQISLFTSSSEIAGNWSITEDLEKLEKLIDQQEVMTNEYDAVITNPPYMGGKGYTDILKKYVEKNYKDSKADLFAVFIEKCSEYTKQNRYTSMITMHSWMFLSSFETLRKNIIEFSEIVSLNHLGARAFEEIGGEVVQTVAWVSRKRNPILKGDYIRLVDYNNAEWKEKEFFNQENKYQANQKDFEKIPGSPISYWVSSTIFKIFEEEDKLKNVSESAGRTKTHNDEKYLRYLWEVNSNYKEKWRFCNKGGLARKWYGNLENIIKWDLDALEEYKFHGGLRNEKYEKTAGITWGMITSGKSTYRIKNKNSEYTSASPVLVLNDQNKINYTLGYLNSKISEFIINILNPTINLSVGEVIKLPFVDFESCENINKIVENNISISKQEWDSRETSWDFKSSPLLGSDSLSSAYDSYCDHWRGQFVQMHKNEEELNRLFIEIYGLQDEMDEQVDFEDITILKKETAVEIIYTPPSLQEEMAEREKTSEGYLYNRGALLSFSKEEIMKQFLSYAVGCIMGRYSLDKPGLIMANSDDELILSDDRLVVKGKDGEIRHEIESPKFIPDAHGIIPVVAEDIFENDIVSRVVEFVKAVYGEATLEENLDFIAEALGRKKGESSREVIRRYFIKDFYKDHLQRYKKRPIYWMMKSGKKDAFSALIYLHRYEENSIGRVRADYLIPYQEMLDNQRGYYEMVASDEATTPKDKKDAEKKLKELDASLKELKDYANEVKHIADQKIKLDLDDGVKVNYEKFGKILGKI